MSTPDFSQPLLAPNEAVADYWLEHYCTFACTLCGNSGKVDTTGVCTAAGVPVGRRQWCICPNGQIMRAHLGSEPLP